MFFLYNLLFFKFILFFFITYSLSLSGWRKNFQLAISTLLPSIVDTLVKENNQPLEKIIENGKNVWMYFFDARKLDVLKTEDTITTTVLRFVPPP